jgi:hypothetical protein
MSQKLGWIDAIKAVLQDAQEPMSAQEIVDAIYNRGLRSEMGATPASTVGSRISTSIKNDGNTSPFIRTQPGRFFLNSGETTTVPSVGPKDLTEKGPEEGTSQITGIVNALGMFWERSKVYWDKYPRLFGFTQKGTRVDFSAQQGIYLLHDSQGVVYVGKTDKQGLGVRLKQHTTDRLNGRWDRFSWFGVFPVTEDGSLNSNANFSGIMVPTVIAAMEAVLIEALEPRQNRRGGDWNVDAIEFIQEEDPEIEVRRNKAAVMELVNKKYESPNA